MKDLVVIFVINDYQKRYYHSIRQFVTALSGGYAAGRGAEVYFPAAGGNYALDAVNFKKFVAKNAKGTPFLSLPYPKDEAERKDNLKKNKAWDKAWIDERVKECEKLFIAE